MNLPVGCLPKKKKASLFLSQLWLLVGTNAFAWLANFTVKSPSPRAALSFTKRYYKTRHPPETRHLLYGLCNFPSAF